MIRVQSECHDSGAKWGGPRRLPVKHGASERDMRDIDGSVFCCKMGFG